MSLDSLRMKQHKLQLESDTRDTEGALLESIELDVLEKKPQLEHANQEWKQFYEVIKDITNNMRY